MNIRKYLQYMTIVDKMLIDPWRPALIDLKDRWRKGHRDSYISYLYYILLTN